MSTWLFFQVIQDFLCWFCTLNSVIGSGHVKYQENPLACKLHGNPAWKIISFYLLYSHIPIIWQGFTWPVIMLLVHGISTVTKHGTWSCKSQKRDWPCILYGHSQSRYWECILVVTNPVPGTPIPRVCGGGEVGVRHDLVRCGRPICCMKVCESFMHCICFCKTSCLLTVVHFLTCVTRIRIIHQFCGSGSL